VFLLTPFWFLWRALSHLLFNKRWNCCTTDRQQARRRVGRRRARCVDHKSDAVESTTNPSNGVWA